MNPSQQTKQIKALVTGAGYVIVGGVGLTLEVVR